MGILSKIWKAVTGWLKPDVPEAERGFNIEKKSTNQPIPVIYGYYAKAPCIKIFKMNTDIRGGAKNEYMHFICVICEGPVNKLGTVYFNGISEHAIENKRYHIERFTGEDNQAHCATLTAQFPEWKDTAQLNGVAYLYIRLRQNKKVDWWRGEPKITVDVEGRLVNDPRDNTRKYTTNLALCGYDFLTNKRFGKGMPIAKINTQSVIDFANSVETERQTYTRTITRREYDQETRSWITYVVGEVEDAVVENKFCANMMLDTDKEVKSNVDVLNKGMRAYWIDSNGQYHLRGEDAVDPVFAFTPDNMVGEIDSDGGNQNNRYNQVVIKYRNRLTGEMDQVTFPEDKAQHERWKNQEDGGKFLPGQFTFENINNKAEALQMAHVICHRSRQDINATWQGLPETIVVEVGDVVTVPSKIDGWTAKPFLVDRVEIDTETGIVNFQGREHQKTIYPWAVTSVTEEYIDTSHVIQQSIEVPTGLALTAMPADNQHYGELTWDDPNDTAISEHDIYVYQEVDGSSDALVFSKSTSEHSVLIPLFNAGDYRIEVYAKNSLFVSNAAILSFSAQLPIAPSSLGLIASTFEIAAVPTIAKDNHFVEFELMVNDEDNRATADLVGRGRSFAIIGRQPNTRYYLWARTITPYGNSGWVSASVDTLDGQNLIEIISQLPNLDVSELKEKVEALDTEVTEEIRLLDDEVANLLSGLILNTVQQQENVTSDVQNVAEIKEVNELVTQEEQARVNQGNALESAIETEKGRTDSVITRIDSVETDVAGNSQAISVTDGRARSAGNTANAAYTIAQQAKTDSSGNASSITNIRNIINDTSTGLSATAALALLAKQTADGSQTGIATLRALVDDPTRGVLANAALALQAKQLADGSASALASLQASIDSIAGSGAATTADLQLAVDANKGAIAALSALISDEATGLVANAGLALSASQKAQQANNDITSLKAEAYLHATVNNVVAGIKASSNGTVSTLKFASDMVEFLKRDGKRAIFLNHLEDELEFHGQGNFYGTIYAENLVGEQASGAAKVLSHVSLTASYQSAVSFNVASAKWDRVIVIPCPWFNPSSSGEPDCSVTVDYLVDGANLYRDGIVKGSFKSGYFSSSPRYYRLPANRSVRIDVNVKLNAGSGNATMFEQGYTPTVFKNSNEISFN